MPLKSLQHSLEDYVAAVTRLPAGRLNDSDVRVRQFRLLDCDERGIEIFWAPFDHVNRHARVALVGITPGATQMKNAFQSARDALNEGLKAPTAARKAKTQASFSGPMREVLVDWLDGIGIARRLELSTSAELWDSAASFAHFTSTLRYPVFRNGERYSGTPTMLSHPDLRRCVDEVFLREMKSVSPQMIIGLGTAVKDTLRYAARQGAVKEERVLFDLPHPSKGKGFPEREAQYHANRRRLRAKVTELLP